MTYYWDKLRKNYKTLLPSINLKVNSKLKLLKEKVKNDDFEDLDDIQ